MSEHKHADLWKKLVDEAGEQEIDRGPSVSVEQAKADLKAAGFDVAAERAKANTFLDALESGAPRTAPRVAPQVPRTRPRPSIAWLAAAAALGGVAGGVLVAALQQRATLEGASAPAAADLRRQATAACDAKAWSLCLADLDQARAADPGGDDAPAVKSLRHKAIAAIVQKPEPPPLP